ncbi:MAG TPA: polyprenyl synthetase family protein [Chthoniobacteraceae bacterium]|nr:polyprenyl synthetase family protein [Chthoniobacteraceae bacterium]
MKELSRAEIKAANIPREIRATFELIKEPLANVEERIRAQAREFDPAVEGYVAYACESSGKRLRPALVLLAAGATGAIQPVQVELAVILELIHAATLVHDDIMDGADIRRGEPTVNAKWGNTISVLLGDCMFAHALKLSTQFTSTEVTRRIADATAEVCSGEIMQTQRRFDLNLSVADYFKIIEMKTAALFGAATELGAQLNNAPPEVVEAMRLFGLKLGIAYQIYDDCLDLAGDEAKAGKTLGSDLRKGKLTLPLLHLLRECDENRRARWSEVILSGNGVEALVREVKERGALDVAVTTARGLLGEAREQLELVADGPFRRGLADLCRSVDRLLRQF